MMIRKYILNYRYYRYTNEDKEIIYLIIDIIDIPMRIRKYILNYRYYRYTNDEKEIYT